MKVAVFGTGYVGLVQGAVLADAGHDVICVDVDEQKVNALKEGVIPIFEPGLDDLVKGGIALNKLCFTSTASNAVQSSEVIFIAVGTPPDEDGSADLKYVLSVAKTIAEHMNSYKVVVNKSTVPIGTADKVTAVLSEVLAINNNNALFDVVSNPEFLKEGSAVSDCQRPDRIILGTDSRQAEKILRELYAPFNRQHDKIIVMGTRSAELTKYAANCMLATKISFMNEMSNLAERLGADIEDVRQGIGSDSRIGYSFIYPGAGYGGSCFPKDVQALIHMAENLEFDSQILKAVEAVNHQQKRHLLALIDRHYSGLNVAQVNTGISSLESQSKNQNEKDLSGKTFAIWGLSFKPQTDDMREATSRVVIEGLFGRGAKVQAYDPEAMGEAQRIYGSSESLLLCESKELALQGADALIVCTEWKHFWAPVFSELKESITDKVIFDGRNIYDPDKVQEAGMFYYGIGRGLSCQ